MVRIRCVCPDDPSGYDSVFQRYHNRIVGQSDFVTFPSQASPTEFCPPVAGAGNVELSLLFTIFMDRNDAVYSDDSLVVKLCGL